MFENSKKNPLSEKISIAPMVSYTNAYARHFYSLLAPSLIHYSEMIPATSLIRNPNIPQIKKFNQTKSKTICQFASNNIAEMIAVAKIAKQNAYAEINLNLGCPSKAIQKKQVGVCMMKDSQFMADFYFKINKAIELPISIKCRNGVDEFDSYDYLADFVAKLAQSGCQKFIIHARKAWLKGLNPSQNRTKPPIDYQKVYRLKKDFPNLNFIINGQISTINQIEHHLKKVDGVMIGREIIRNPLLAHQIQNHFFEPTNIDNLLAEYFRFAKQVIHTHPLAVIFLLKPLFGLAYQKQKAKNWRKMITDQMINKNIDSALILKQAKNMQMFD